MLRIVVVALVVELVLLTLLTQSPTDAASRKFENYMWSFADVSSNQVVCKKMVIYPEKESVYRGSKSIKMYSTSIVVNDSYCANLAKPYQASSQSHQS